MNTGLGNAAVRSSKVTPPTPATVTAANNGNSLSLTTVQLGQAIGAVGDPAILLNDRELPMAGFSFEMLSAGNGQILIDPAGDYKFGDYDFGVNGTSIVITDPGKTILLQATDELKGLDPNTGNTYLDFAPVANFYKFGDISNKHNHTLLNIDDATPEVRIESGGNLHLDFRIDIGFYMFGDNAAGTFLGVDQGNGKIDGLINGDSVLYADKTLGIYHFGDVDSTGNGLFLSVRDDLGYIDLGDVNGTVNGTKLIINDAAQNIQIVDGSGNPSLYIDIPNGQTAIGDFFQAFNSTYIFISDNTSVIECATNDVFNIINSINKEFFKIEISTGSYKIGDISNSANNSVFSIDDTTEIFSLISGGGAGVGGIQTNPPTATGAGLWLLGKKVAAAVAFDAANYVEAMIDGVVYKLALAN